MTDIINEKRYQFLWELIRAIVVRTVGDDNGHTVGVVESTHKMVAAGFRCAVRRMRIVLRRFQEELVSVSQVMLSTAGRGGERRLYAVGMSQLQSTVHLVGRDMVEALAFILLRQRFPIKLGSLQQT